MKITEIVAKLFKKFLPSPFTLAIILTIFVFVVALVFQKPETSGFGEYAIQLLTDWDASMWKESLLGFLVQMMLMLVLGHTLALSKPFSKLANKATSYCTTQTRAAYIVTISTILVSLFNWGLGLIFGAILARKVGEK